jgi:hypothetical protein
VVGKTVDGKTEGIRGRERAETAKVRLAAIIGANINSFFHRPPAEKLQGVAYRPQSLVSNRFAFAARL